MEQKEEEGVVAEVVSGRKIESVLTPPDIKSE